ncbi:MAG: hypothetical protein ABGZ19_09980 [Verrucomicrobiales bacterium]|nr:hypothetical protein [Nitrospinaceae bacterium]
MIIRNQQVDGSIPFAGSSYKINSLVASLLRQRFSLQPRIHIRFDWEKPRQRSRAKRVYLSLVLVPVYDLTWTRDLR